MTVEALWSVEIELDAEWAPGGVIVLETSRIFGGDSAFFYLGSFAVQGVTITCKAAINYYSGNGATIWGDAATSFTLEMNGQINDDIISGTVRRTDTGQTKKIRLTKRADLP